MFFSCWPVNINPVFLLCGTRHICASPLSAVVATAMPPVPGMPLDSMRVDLCPGGHG